MRRSIPRTDVILTDPAILAAIERLGRPAAKAAIVRAQEAARRGEIKPEEVVAATLKSLSGSVIGLRPVLNATGVLLHTNLGRAPLSAQAREALLTAAGACDVELDLTTGGRGKRGADALAALREVVPAADGALVVNNGAAALALTAMTLAAGREIVVSRGELVEIGDGFRIPELLAAAGARLHEVGTTNRTHLRDYAEAVGENTAFVLKVHPSNFTVTGFTHSVGVAELASLKVPVVADIGSGLFAPHPLLPDEPDATTTLAAGATLVTASGDKLIGGPQAGIVLGDGALIERIRRHPLARAMRVDKLTLAALEATLRGPTTPTRAALDADPRDLRRRAEALAAELSAIIQVEVVPSEARVGGGGAPDVVLQSWAVALPAALAPRLRIGAPAVLGRVERGRCLLDLRAIDAADDAALAAAVRTCS